MACKLTDIRPDFELGFGRSEVPHGRRRSVRKYLKIVTVGEIKFLSVEFPVQWANIAQSGVGPFDGMAIQSKVPVHYR